MCSIIKVVTRERHLYLNKLSMVVMPVSAILERPRQDSCEFQNSMVYRVRLCLKTDKKIPKHPEQKYNY